MRNGAVTVHSHFSKPALLNPVAVKCRGPACVTDKVPVTHSGRVRLCRGHSFRGVWGHGEWIAYLLHQWFSRCRGLMGGEDARALKEDTVSKLFWGAEGEQLLFLFFLLLLFYEVALRTDVTLVGNCQKMRWFMCNKIKSPLTASQNSSGSLKL